MARVALTPVVAKGPFPGALSAGDLKLTETAGDASVFNSWVPNGREILVAHNTDSGGHHITLHSVADAQGRTGDITSYALGAGEVHVFSFFGSLLGWLQNDGSIYVDVDDATVKLAVLRVS